MSKRSAITPPHAPNRSIGRNCSAGLDAEREAVVVGQAQDQPRLREPLHPRAAHRDDLPDEVQAVVAVLERRERRATEAAGSGHASGILDEPFEQPRGALEQRALVGGERPQPAREVLRRAGGGWCRPGRGPPRVGSTSATRRSSSDGTRVARPFCSSKSTTRVIVGGWTRSASASCERVRLPSADDHRERRQLRRRDVLGRVLAQPATEPHDREPELRRQLGAADALIGGAPYS